MVRPQYRRLFPSRTACDRTQGLGALRKVVMKVPAKDDRGSSFHIAHRTNHAAGDEQALKQAHLRLLRWCEALGRGCERRRRAFPLRPRHAEREWLMFDLRPWRRNRMMRYISRVVSLHGGPIEAEGQPRLVETEDPSPTRRRVKLARAMGYHMRAGVN